MTRPVNIYMLSRITGEEAFNHVYHHAAEKHSHKRTALHEMQSLRTLVDEMASFGAKAGDFDGFFFGYDIPQIGKEFDLLKFRGNACINIELKSQPVPLEQIRSQLLKNRHYLSHLGRELTLFTFVSDSCQCFTLTSGDVLSPVSIQDIAKAALAFAEDFDEEIDGLFKASEYMVSPVGTPDKFLRGEYFLTQAQEMIRKDLLTAIEDTTDTAFFSLTGKPGTGKTLLLYDIAKALGEQAQTAILHWGEPADGHRIINEADLGLHILPLSVLDAAPADADDTISADIATHEPAPADERPADITTHVPAPADERPVPERLASYSYLLADDATRLTPAQFEAICESARRNHQRCVFCMDPEQVLSTVEREHDIAGKMATLPPAEAFVLSERLRGNSELRSFIRQVRDLTDQPKTHLPYRNVDLCYASTASEAQNLLEYFRSRDYVFINYAKAAGPGDPYARFEGGYDIHHVIGQEFDRIVMLLDSSFYYTDDGKLEGIPRPDPDVLYPNLFYQGVTRVREKLALIVLDNEAVFDKIAAIVKE